ncbi:putative phosphatase regulatory subunit [Dictyocaulus viviparus]|uniref:Putative phosphatase regulatory subunit n=1 Tax=Dictyocaulus viviparus TaxID=29172 RepID=A0A0D8Y7M5_DICVI|nr:putative phosphatase regulatory subunit [Dictyocaulus viviparus]
MNMLIDIVVAVYQPIKHRVFPDYRCTFQGRAISLLATDYQYHSLTSMEETVLSLSDALSCLTIMSTKELNRKKLGLKLVSEKRSLYEYDSPSLYYSNPTDGEPISPDSGFSSDESGSPFVQRDTRSRTLPSALRCSQSKVCTKRVRFADALGLDLEIRQYFTEKESFSFPTQQTSATPEIRLVLSNFTYHSESECNQLACDEKVCLAKLTAHGRSLIGQINVANISFFKEVVVRYTTNDWTTFDEVAASYSHNVFGVHNVDAFVFSISLKSEMKTGQCEFCVRFTVNGFDFWDNNRGKNYQVKMEPKFSSPNLTFEVGPTVSSAPKTNSTFTPRRLRRWRRAQEESDDESSPISIPYRRAV